MHELTSLPIEYLSISRFRARGDLPWPDPVSIINAQRDGLTDVVVVRRTKENKEGHEHYEILKGLPAWLLAQKASIREVPAMILEDIGDREARDIVRGEDGPDPIAIAETIDDYCQSNDASVAAAGRHFGMSRAQAGHLRRLLGLQHEVKDMVRDRKLSFRHGKILVSLPQAKQLEIAHRIERDGLSTRQSNELIGSLMKQAPESQATAAVDKDPNTRRLEVWLGDKLGAPVSIDYGAGGGGTLRVGFPDLDCLDGILAHLGYRHE